MDSPALYRLMAWLSPSYPVGAFSYSHGLEWLVEAGTVHDRSTLVDWLSQILLLGSGRNDAIFFARAHHAAASDDLDLLRRLAELSAAYAASRERQLETTQQGNAFSDVTRRTWQSATLDRLLVRYRAPLSYPVAVAVAAADHGIALKPALDAYLHAFAANLISAGIRLVPLGHSDGQRALMEIELAVAGAADAGFEGDLSALGGTTLLADIASMRHEMQYTRIFRS
jgi:urease accessory protein